MGRRGPKSFGTSHNPSLGEQEWLWFFSGLRYGFPEEVWYVPVIPEAPKLQTHPILLNELKNIPIHVKVEKRTSGGFLPEKKIWYKLLAAKTIREVRKACKGSRYWPRNDARVQDPRVFYYLSLVCDLARVLLAAKQEKRYPKSERPTSEMSRIRFLARAMAGASVGITPRYANEKASTQQDK